MKEHFCPAEQSMIAFEKQCNWCGEKETLAQTQEPLTDEMIWELAEQYGAQIGDTFDYVGYTKAIEAKLKEKNT